MVVTPAKLRAKYPELLPEDAFPDSRLEIFILDSQGRHDETYYSQFNFDLLVELHTMMMIAKTTQAVKGRVDAVSVYASQKVDSQAFNYKLSEKFESFKDAYYEMLYQTTFTTRVIGSDKINAPSSFFHRRCP